jgi:hypothetical protein
MDQADAQFHFVLNQSPNNIPALLGEWSLATILEISFGFFCFFGILLYCYLCSSSLIELDSNIELYLLNMKLSGTNC